MKRVLTRSRPFWVLTVLAVSALAAGLLMLIQPKPSEATFPGQNGKIAFVEYQKHFPSGIFTINPNGTDLTLVLAADGARMGRPFWSPDGSKIVFQASDSLTSTTNPEGDFDIFVMNADGSNLTNLTDTSTGYDEANPGYDEAYPTWTPDGTKIAFLSDGGRSEPGETSGLSDVYVMNADGSDKTRLASPGSFPAWSPDSSKIAYSDSTRDVNNPEGDSEIYVSDADGSNESRLTNNRADDCDPKWSPDGSKITFLTIRDGNNEIYAINSDGSNLSRLTNNESDDLLPEWSPDGTKIAFLCGDYGGIWTMNPDGSDLTPTINLGRVENAPVWSPDGTKMLIISARSDTSDPGQPLLYTANADGTDLAPLFPVGSSSDDYDTSRAAYGDWQPLLAPTRPESRAECKKGGYKAFSFKTQGKCIASLK